MAQAQAISGRGATQEPALSGASAVFANAFRQPLASHCALVGLLARKYIETHHPRLPHYALGALLAGFLHDIGKLDPKFQEHVALGEPPDSPFGAGPRLQELSWAMMHLAFDEATVRKHLPKTLPWHVVQYVVYWRNQKPDNACEARRFATLEQICKRAGLWIAERQDVLVEIFANIAQLTQIPLFEMRPKLFMTPRVETPAYRPESSMARTVVMPSGELKAQESMTSVIARALQFADRMVSRIGAQETQEWLQAWCNNKVLPDLAYAPEIDDYTTIPLDMCTNVRDD